jgi:hypothetical protein
MKILLKTSFIMQSRFNKQFLDSQLGGNPVTISIGRMLTVMNEQDNTIRVLSRILGRDYNEQHLHDMHNSLFGDPSLGGHSIGREGMHMGNLLNQLTTFIHQQNQQIQALIEEIRKNVKQINDYHYGIFQADGKAIIKGKDCE